MTQNILKIEPIENGKNYVKRVFFEDGHIEVWKAPRPESNFHAKLIEEFNEIAYGKTLDENINSGLNPHLSEIEQQFGVSTTYIEEIWNPSLDVQTLKNSDKLTTFYVYEVWWRQTDRNKGTDRHIRLKLNQDGTRSLYPIDNGFILMNVDLSNKDQSKDLNPEWIDNLLSAQFVKGWEEIKLALVNVDNFQIERVIGETACHLTLNSNCSNDTKQYIFKYAMNVIEYLTLRKSMLRGALEKWWQWKQQVNSVQTEIPNQAVP